MISSPLPNPARVRRIARPSSSVLHEGWIVIPLQKRSSFRYAGLSFPFSISLGDIVPLAVREPVS